MQMLGTGKGRALARNMVNDLLTAAIYDCCPNFEYFPN